MRDHEEPLQDARKSQNTSSRERREAYRPLGEQRLSIAIFGGIQHCSNQFTCVSWCLTENQLQASFVFFPWSAYLCWQLTGDVILLEPERWQCWLYWQLCHHFLQNQTVLRWRSYSRPGCQSICKKWWNREQIYGSINLSPGVISNFLSWLQLTLTLGDLHGCKVHPFDGLAQLVDSDLWFGNLMDRFRILCISAETVIHSPEVFLHVLCLLFLGCLWDGQLLSLGWVDLEVVMNIYLIQIASKTFTKIPR